MGKEASNLKMRTLVSFLMGLLLAAANLFLLVRIVRRITEAASRRRLALLVAAKFLIFFGIIALILWKGHVRPLAFLAGFSIPLIGYLIVAFRKS